MLYCTTASTRVRLLDQDTEPGAGYLRRLEIYPRPRQEMIHPIIYSNSPTPESLPLICQSQPQLQGLFLYSDLIPKMVFQLNAKDSMKSTWLHGDQSQWTYAHRMLARAHANHPEYDRDVPVHAKTDPVPYLSQRSQYLFIFTHAITPIAVQQILSWTAGWKSILAWQVFPLYLIGAASMVVRQSSVLRYLDHVHGYFDGDSRQRDGVPDVGVKKVVSELFMLLFGRSLLSFLFRYKTTSTPVAAMSSLQCWLWAQITSGNLPYCPRFLVLLVSSRHARHTRSVEVLSGYADEEPVIGDIIGVSLMTVLTLHALRGLSFEFDHWWICGTFILYGEAIGHSGLRVHMIAPSTLAHVLDYFGVALTIEDHDLHHRKGHRKSFDYGKQTRIWDRLLGTTHERYESGNVDYTNQAFLPIF